MADNKEKFCSGCKHDSKLATESPCNECCNTYTSKFEAKTNFDHVKEMTFDEMVDFLTGIFNGKECVDKIYKRIFGREVPKINTKESMREWLESEVENNEWRKRGF